LKICKILKFSILDFKIFRISNLDFENSGSQNLRSQNLDPKFQNLRSENLDIEILKILDFENFRFSKLTRAVYLRTLGGRALIAVVTLKISRFEILRIKDPRNRTREIPNPKESNPRRIRIVEIRQKVIHSRFLRVILAQGPC